MHKSLSAGAIVSLMVLGSVSLALSAEASYDPGWGVAEVIETEDLGDALYPSVAVDGEGNAFAVWEQSDGLRTNMWANRYVAGVGWGVACLIESDNVGDAMHADVAVDGLGNAVAVWYQSDGVRPNIWANRYVAGEGWGTAVMIETNDVGWAVGCKVAVDRDGNAVAVWDQWDVRWNIWSNRYVVGEGWGTAELLETDNTGDASSADVAVDGSGEATAVWSQGHGGPISIWSARLVPGEGWGDPVLIETEDLGDAYAPRVVVDAAGNALAVWEQSDGVRSNIVSNRYVHGVGWGTAARVEGNDVTDARRPDVAVGPDGNATAVWDQMGTSASDIWANRYVVGEGWQTPARIETGDAGNAYHARAAMDDAGNALVVWYQNDGTRYNIVSNRFALESGWETHVLIETENVGSAFEPVVAMDGAGTAFAVWYQRDGMRYNIWSNRFVSPDTTPPLLEVHHPYDGQAFDTRTVSVLGVTEAGVSLTVNGLAVTVAPNGTFSCVVSLPSATSEVVVVAADGAGNSVVVTRTVTYVDPVIALEDELDDVLNQLDDVRDQLDDADSDLADARRDLDALEDELRDVSSDLSGLRWLTTMLAVAVMALVLLIIAMLLRKGREPRRPAEEPAGPEGDLPAMSAAMEHPPAAGGGGGVPETASAQQSAPEGAPAKKPRKPRSDR